MPHNDESRLAFRLNGQVRPGAPPGTRTPNPRIKSIGLDHHGRVPLGAWRGGYGPSSAKV